MGLLTANNGMISSLQETALKSSPSVADLNAQRFSELIQQAQSTGDFKVLEDYLSSQGDYWKNLVSSNPFKNLQYHESRWQRMLSKLGFRTGYDSFLEQQQLQSNEYLSGLMQQFYRQQYDTPDAQAARMREAGQNPDLLGTGDVQSAPSPTPDENYMSPETFSADDAQQAVNAVSGVTSLIGDVVTKAFSFAAAGQNIQSQKLANGNAVLDMALKAIAASSSPDATTDLSGGEAGSGRVVSSNYANLIRKLPISNKYKKQMISSEGILRNGLSSVSDVAKTRAGLGDDLLNSFINGKSSLRSWRGLNSDDVQDDLKLLSMFRDEVTGMVYDFENRVLRFQFRQLNTAESENQVNQDYWNSMDGAQVAQSELASAQVNIAQSNDLTSHMYGEDGLFRMSLQVQKDAMQLKKALAKKQSELVDKLTASADEGKWFSRALMASIVGINFVEDSGIASFIEKVVQNATGVGRAIGAAKGISNFTTVYGGPKTSYNTFLNNQ